MTAIRALKENDAEQVFELSSEAGWRHTTHSMRDFIKACPGAYLGMFADDGTLISCCAGVIINEKQGYLGLFLSRKKYRGKGYGRQVFEKVMEVLGERNVMLTGVNYMVPYYQRNGFKLGTNYGIIIVEGVPKIPNDYSPQADVTIAPIADTDLDDVISYDQSVASFPRPLVVSTYLKSDQVVVKYTARLNGDIVGYISFRKGLHDELLVNGFQADTLEIAESLFFECASNLAQGSKLQIPFSRSNAEQCKKLYSMFGLNNFVDSDEGMFTKEDIPVDWERVYGVMGFFSMML